MASRRKLKARERELPAGGGAGILHGRAWWWLALFLGVFPIAFRQVSVSDAWWHVALGKWLVVERTLPDLSKFYFSPFDAGWLAGELRWEWLGDIVFYLCYEAAGAAGLQWLVIGCVMAGLGFLALLAPAAGLNGSLARFRLFQPGRSRHTGETPAPPVLCKADSALPGPWVLLLLVTVCLGTYQLQLARNSVFSLALYPAVLWLGLRRCGPPTWREYAAIGGVLVLWSCLHGSCMLGWATAFVIFGTRAASAFREKTSGGAGESLRSRTRGDDPVAESGTGFPACEPAQTQAGKPVPHCRASRHDWAEEGGKRVGLIGWMSRLNIPAGVRCLLLFCAAFSISLALVVAGRPGAVDFLLLPVRHVVSAVEMNAPPTKSVPDSATKKGTVAQAPQKAQSVKTWLNSSIWKPDPATPWSNDYWSPFDMLPGMRPIEAAFALAILAAACMAWFRNVPIGLLLAWAGAVFLGIGYVRMFGYTALASGAAIIGCAHGVRASPVVRRCGWASVGAWIIFSWWALFGARIETLIPEGQHVSRFGQVPIFEDAACDWLAAEYPEEKVFTTIESGSYCLLRWNFQKPVFLDGFFAPHTREVWDAYHAALDTGNLSGLHDRFGITAAIIPTTSGPWVQRFLHSPDWNPAAIGAGSIVFLHKTVPLGGRSPEIFFAAGDLLKTSAYFRYHALRNVFLVTATAKPDGFAPEQWARLPASKGFRELAKEVFPAKPEE